MAYLIQNLNHHPLEQRNYLLDANIWLFILSPRISKRPEEIEYRNFIEKLIQKSKAKIVVPALILSEVINSYLRNITMIEFAKKRKDNYNKRGYYKKKYRPSDEFKVDYELLCDDIKNYHNSYELIPDDCGTSFKPKHLLKSPPKELDFNDYYYYQLAKKNGYIIVTDDGDFFVEDVEIITLNKKLLKKVAKL